MYRIKKCVFFLIGMTLALTAETMSCDRRARSPHFKNGIFHNSKKLEKKTLWKTIKSRLTHPWSTWPNWVDIPEGERPMARVQGSQVRITFINHSTFLIQTAGYNILTDPIYSQRCGPAAIIGVKRTHRPSIAFNELPKIDIVLISHDHYDHLDLHTVSRLVDRDNPKIFMGLGVADHLDFQDRVRIQELDWWESIRINDNFVLSFVETQHSSGRFGYMNDFNTLWGGFVLEIGDKNIYFGGDSGYAEHYKKTFQRFGPMDISLLPIGTYSPRNHMKNQHMEPRESVLAHLDLHSKKSIGMHYGTFQLSAEKREAPPQLLEIEKRKASIPPDEFVTLELGKTLVID